jgi:hypothetical protein
MANNRLESIKRIFNSSFARVALILVISGIFLILTVGIPPFRAFGGAVWLKDGVHYISDEQISSRVEQINNLKEAAIAEEIKVSTQSCDSLNEGYCQINPGEYTYKTLVKSAVEHIPAVPDRKEIIGYCTLCNDGTLSPSCAVGRGACSWHGGVAQYNYPRYRVITGSPEVLAQPAEYSYDSKTYKDSDKYNKPETPSLDAIISLTD